MAKIYKFPERRKAKAIETQETWGEQLIERVFGPRYRFGSEEATFVHIVKSCSCPEELNAILKMAKKGLRISRDVQKQRMVDFKYKMKRTTSPRSKAAYKGWLTQTKKHLAFVRERMEWVEGMVAYLRGYRR